MSPCSVAPEPLALIADGTFDPCAVETSVVDFDQAAKALSEPFTKLVLTAGEASDERRGGRVWALRADQPVLRSDRPASVLPGEDGVEFGELVVAHGDQRVSRPGRA